MSYAERDTFVFDPRVEIKVWKEGGVWKYAGTDIGEDPIVWFKGRSDSYEEARMEAIHSLSNYLKHNIEDHVVETHDFGKEKK